MEFREDDEMPMVAEAAEPVSVLPSSDNTTSLLLKKARKLLRGNKRKLSPSPSCSVNSPFCEGPRMKRMFLVEHSEEVMKQSGDAERVERYRTGLSSSSVSDTDTLLLEMTLGGNKKLWEMHSLGLDEKVMKEFGNDKTGNNSTTLSPPPSFSVNSSFPVEIHGDRIRQLEATETIRFQIDVQKRLHEQLEVQRQLQLRIEEQGKYLRKIIESRHKLEKERDGGVRVKEREEAGSIGEGEKVVNGEEEEKEMPYRFLVLRDGFRDYFHCEGRNKGNTSRSLFENQGKSDLDADVIALSPRTLLATNIFECEICGLEFPSEQQLQLHRRVHKVIALSPRTLLATQIFECEICGLEFPSEQQLQLHRRVHKVIALSPRTLLATNIFECEICGLEFPNEQKLLLHRRVHTFPWKHWQR